MLVRYEKKKKEEKIPSVPRGNATHKQFIFRTLFRGRTQKRTLLHNNVRVYTIRKHPTPIDPARITYLLHIMFMHVHERRKVKRELSIENLTKRTHFSLLVQHVYTYLCYNIYLRV